jgi:hypothetical protein
MAFPGSSKTSLSGLWSAIKMTSGLGWGCADVVNDFLGVTRSTYDIGVYEGHV